MSESFEKVIEKITDTISAEFPQIKEILDRAYKGEITEEQALGEMMNYTNANPSIANKIAEIFMSNASDSGEETLESANEIFVMPKQYSVESAESDLKPSLYDMIWEDRSDQGKRARFNPQYESYLVERLQFDGDAPELRTSVMDKDTVPAVDVVAQSRNPIVVGDQLKKASDQVRAEQDQLEEEYTKQIAEKTESGEFALTKTSTELDRSSIPQPLGYESGKLPVPREIEEMSSDQLLCLSEDIKRENIWKVLATTQGRRSVTSIITQIVKEQLEKHDYKVRVDLNATGRVMSVAHWTITIKSASELQENFSLLETCAYSIAYNLMRNLKDEFDPSVTYSLHLKTINEYSVREVGWGARLMLETE
jgi:hypothetical protein